jgi:hypothetical protein
MKVIDQFTLPTANRGTKTYVISATAKGFFAHELGELTPWAQVMATGERTAHRINPTVRRGNRWGRYFKPQPFRSFHSARIAAQLYAGQHILRS